MRIIKLCLVALAAVFALSVVAASGASAAEVLFSSNVIGAGFSSHGGVGHLVASGGTAVECKKVTNKGTFTDQHLGKVEILFEECTEELFKGTCTSEGATIPGHITLEIEWHLGLADPGNLPAILMLVKLLKIKCSLGNIEVRGSVIGQLRSKGVAVKVGEKLKEAELVFEQTSGKPKYKEFLLSLAGGALDKAELEANVLGGGFKESAEETTDTLNEFTTTSKEVELIEG
jgi:hypothetical protein